jgi:hypothetical protein
MRPASKLFLVLALWGCSNLNQVRTDGGRNLNGKVVEIIYVESDKSARAIESKLIQEFGEPYSRNGNEIIWKLSSKNTLSVEALTMITHTDSVFHFKGKEQIFEFVNFDVCLTDNSGNDLLTRKEIRDKGCQIFQRLFTEMR